MKNQAVGADKNNVSSGKPCIRRLTRTIRESDRAAGVTKQGIREAEFLREGLVLLDGVKAHTKHVDIQVLIGLIVVAKLATLKRSAGGVCFRVKP